TTQHAKLYDNGSVTWESDIVSGNSSKGYDTPTGVYSIDSYMTSTASSGSRVKLISPEVDAEGNPTYTSYVDYWIPFIGNLVALHDATWRSSFGGTIYQTNGSHGCVNLPASAAASLYSLVKVGDVVVVHD
ncbi:MAG: L,D-transpeptidase, partial [Atopobium sp.]|nr:L,D-transpeptidase [Atopobium sp.]